jgi:SAM-dependent methyltransferase
MLQPSVSIPEHSSRYSNDSILARSPFVVESPQSIWNAFLDGGKRRWRRGRRRRKIGRAYDMALEIARVVPANSRVLDVGCGNGFITHHLAAILGTEPIGIDLAPTTEATIDYRQFDGRQFPVTNNSIDTVLLCYVLHHAQDIAKVMSEMRRVLSKGSLAVIYEDIPASAWDRVVCGIHDLKWRKRTGPCTFRREESWRTLFDSEGFEVLIERPLSRWRNLSHPVRRRFYLLRLK